MPIAEVLRVIGGRLRRDPSIAITHQDEFWWLVLLESTLCFSLYFWEPGPPYSAPSFHPFRFATVTFLAATTALFLCHLGPAFLAARQAYPSLPLGGLMLIWLTAGYVEQIPFLIRTMIQPLSESGALAPMREHFGTWVHPAVWLGTTATVFCLGWKRAWWKPVASLSVASGIGMLAWCLNSAWRGIGVLNPYFSKPPIQLEWLIWKHTLLAAAPVVVIAWRLGEVATNRTRIWVSGLAGLWLPIIVSLVAASLATEAGANLWWRPSLPRGFYWALLGSEGRLTATAIAVCGLTMLAPALVCAHSIRLLAQTRAWRWNPWLLPLAAVPVIFVFRNLFQPGEELRNEWDSPFHDFWDLSLLLLGASAGLAALLRTHPQTPVAGTAQPTAAQYPAETAPLPPAESD